MESNLQKSLQLLQVEKMVIILKELEHIKNILNFFNGYKDEVDEKPIKRNISYLKNDIISLQHQIKKLKNINNNLKNKEPMIFVIQYDYIRTQIEDMLRVIQALYNKMQQLFGETLNQYIPYPILGRRYSNNGIMIYLGNYYREMLKQFSPEHTNKLILGWNYKTGFQYRVFINREIKREHYKEDTYNDYIDLPYWYYELPFLLPSITHEVAFIALRKPNKEIKAPYKKLKKTIKTFLEDKNNNFVQKVQDILGFDEYGNDLAKVILCDIIGFEIHKESYINALFHNIIGEKLSKDYLKIIHDGQNEEFKIIPNDWYFVQKKDHSILRLHFLLSLCKDHKEYKSMINILNNIMPLEQKDKKHNGFEQVYHNNYPNFKTSYEAVQNYLSQLLKVLQLWEVKNRHLISKIKIKDIEKSPSFNKLWDDRFRLLKENRNIVAHQNSFRREIHTKVSKLDFLTKKNSNKESIIYLLELGKARKDFEEKSNLNEMIQEEITNSNKGLDAKEEIEKFYVYGIYDWFTLKEKKSTVEITKKLEELLEEPKQSSNNLLYFKTKQVLMKIHDGVEGENITNHDENFSIIFNIEILKKIDNNQCSNGYSDLNGSVNTIAKHLELKKSEFEKADIYKSLGPKDLTLIIRNSSLTFIFDFLEELNSKEKNQILRTFSMLCSNFDASPKIEKNFTIVSYLRVPLQLKEKNIGNLIANKDMMQYLNKITGVMDFRIIWKKEVTIKNILDFYNTMIAHSYLTDFQTKIEKDIPLV